MNHTPYFPDNITDYAPWVAKHGLIEPYGMCQCGCGKRAPIPVRPTKKLGQTKGEPTAFIRGHYNGSRNVNPPLQERFWAKVNKREPNECWEWHGALDTNGYGKIRADGRLQVASHVSYKIYHGIIPDDLWVLHRCDNPRCVNPNHLFLGTHAQNMQDMVAKGRGKPKSSPGESNPKAKLLTNDVVRIRERHGQGERVIDLAREYNVKALCISRIVNLVTWKHII